MFKTGRAGKAERTYQQDITAHYNKKFMLPRESVHAAFEASRWIPQKMVTQIGLIKIVYFFDIDIL